MLVSNMCDDLQRSLFMLNQRCFFVKRIGGSQNSRVIKLEKQFSQLPSLLLHRELVKYVPHLTGQLYLQR